MEKPIDVWLRRVERTLKWALVVVAVWWGWTTVRPKLLPYIRAVQIGLSSNPKVWEQYESRTGQQAVSAGTLSSSPTPQQGSLGDETQLARLNRALEQQGYHPISLPPGYWSMDVPSQFVVLLNLVRADMGLPALHRDAALDRVALEGARAGTDPPLDGWGWGGVWANIGSPVFSLYAFLYEDGYGVYPDGVRNGACTTPTSLGCWGHRRTLLGNYGPDGQIGAALVYVHGSPSFAAALAPGP